MLGGRNLSKFPCYQGLGERYAESDGQIEDEMEKEVT